MRKIGLCFTVLALTTLVLAGCSKPPAAEIAAAKESIEAARAVGASDYAPQSMQAAEDAKAALEAELKAQEDKFGVFRSYKVAAQKAATAQAAAEQAMADAQAGKERAREEASRMIAEAKTTLAEVKTLLEKAPRGKGTAADLAAMKADLSVAETAMQEVESAYGDGRYNEAMAKASAARSNVEQVRMEIETAMAARSSARGSRG